MRVLGFNEVAAEMLDSGHVSDIMHVESGKPQFMPPCMVGSWALLLLWGGTSGRKTHFTGTHTIAPLFQNFPPT